MDYFDVLKKAWRITWRYKALWVLGLFAGAGSGGSSGGGNSSYRTGGDEFSGGADAFGNWLNQNVALLIVVIGVLVLIAIVFWVLSVAAQGGLVYGANEAAEERKPSLRTAWGVGFKYWGRTFMIGFVLGLPVIVLAILMGIAIVTMVGGGALLGIGGDSSAAGAGAAAGALGGLCCVLPIFGLLIFAVAVVLGIVYPLALRYGVLYNITFGEAIKRGWYDLRAKRGAFVFWLVMLLPQFAFGVIVLLLLLPFIVPAVALFIAEKYVIGGALVVLAILLMFLPSAIYGTFVSSAWTVFFRRMTGLESPAPAAVPPAPPVGYAPPAPPVTDAPPAPPVTDVPPAPPVVTAPVEPVVEVEPDAPVMDVAPEPQAEAPMAPPVPPAPGEVPPANE